MNNLNVAKIQLNGDPYEINKGTNLITLLKKLKIACCVYVAIIAAQRQSSLYSLTLHNIIRMNLSRHCT